MDSNTLLKIKALEERISHLESIVLSQPVAVMSSSKKKTSIKEFLNDLKLSNDVQRTLAIGYFLEISEGLTSFSKVDLEKGFRSAKEKVPLNINDKIGMCIKNGFMMEAEEKKDNLKSWVLTSSGEKYVKGELNK